MIVSSTHHMIRSLNSNDVYWEQGVYPAWSALNCLRPFPNQKVGAGVEPHYHDNDEIWLFTAGRGEVWLNDDVYPVTPNTLVYTPMGTVHRFQMFTAFANVAIVTRLERQKRATHILVEEDGPPEPTVPGFVVPGERNVGPLVDRGARCPLSEMRLVTFAAGDGVGEAHLPVNEHWAVLDGTIRLGIAGFEVELAGGDVALLRAGEARRLQSDRGAHVALVRE
jgi:mannose-6-phosphate isomerase-like protein (cupin superfamily)